MTTVQPRWRKSSHSTNTSNCVELHHTLDAIRDSKRRDGPTLTAPELPTLVAQVKSGHFDR